MSAIHSLADPPDPGVLWPAAAWIDGIVFGSFATFAAILAVAGIGFMMLAGRIDVRRAIGVIAGCFILFGASVIARGLQTYSGNGAIAEGTATNVMPALPHARPAPSKATRPPVSDDPYAGAALQR